MLRIIPILLFFLSFTSCESENNLQKDKEILFYTISTNKNYNTYISDSVDIYSIKKHDVKDILLAQKKFKLNGERHYISLYTNYPHAPIDGGYLAFELDTLGIIYTKNVTWYSYSSLKSTNDSINNLIHVALENIILNDEFHAIDFSKIRIK